MAEGKEKKKRKSLKYQVEKTARLGMQNSPGNGHMPTRAEEEEAGGGDGGWCQN